MYTITDDERWVWIATVKDMPQEDAALFLLLEKERQELEALFEQANKDPCK